MQFILVNSVLISIDIALKGYMYYGLYVKRQQIPKDFKFDINALSSATVYKGLEKE